MNTGDRGRLIEALMRLSAAFPDWRFGQLVANVAVAAQGPQADAIWDCEDDEMLAAAQRLLDGNRDRIQSPIPPGLATRPVDSHLAAPQ